MRREFDLAREIQRNLLPDQPADDFPIHGLNLVGAGGPWRFYDFLTVADGRTPGGQGYRAGRNEFGDADGQDEHLSSCLGKTKMIRRSCWLLNDELAETAGRRHVVTMAVSVYNPANGETPVCQRRTSAAVYRSRSGVHRELEESSPPPGILPGMTYTDQRPKLDGGWPHSVYRWGDRLVGGRQNAGSLRPEGAA
ncbi:SpoIIE family protein phosphatase [Propionivibrio sp.]|uniref:SpoIIE family protein phosphatase n=1 Tax=Propionivibrio sp. TaxID=2212460 RepID=UPI0025FEDB7F|nr:SpoIIE family protein phosphatase [Propionivibrio sp.]MBK7357153.1 SpoIIE family protein phosphatase [Propionivibrio sp.]